MAGPRGSGRARGGRAGPAGAGAAALGRRAALRARGAAPWPGRGLGAAQASGLHRGEPAAPAPQRPRPQRGRRARPAPAPAPAPGPARPGPGPARVRPRSLRARPGLGPARLCPAPVASGSGPLGPAPPGSLQARPRPAAVGPAGPRSVRFGPARFGPARFGPARPGPVRFGPARPRWRLPRPALPSALRRGVSRPTAHGQRAHAQTKRVRHAARDPAQRVTRCHVGAAAPPPRSRAPPCGAGGARPSGALGTWKRGIEVNIDITAHNSHRPRGSGPQKCRGSTPPSLRLLTAVLQPTHWNLLTTVFRFTNTCFLILGSLHGKPFPCQLLHHCVKEINPKTS